MFIKDSLLRMILNVPGLFAQRLSRGFPSKMTAGQDYTPLLFSVYDSSRPQMKNLWQARIGHLSNISSEDEKAMLSPRFQ